LRGRRPAEPQERLRRTVLALGTYTARVRDRIAVTRALTDGRDATGPAAPPAARPAGVTVRTGRPRGPRPGEFPATGRQCEAGRATRPGPPEFVQAGASGGRPGGLVGRASR